MIILTIRTDKPEAELGIFNDDKKLAYKTWQAHRLLAETIHTEIDKILNKSSSSMNKIEGIVVFRGPGSFTGLRIGLTVANALAYGLDIPIVARGGESWITDGISDLQAGQNERIARPEYGAPPRATKSHK